MLFQRLLECKLLKGRIGVSQSFYFLLQLHHREVIVIQMVIDWPMPTTQKQFQHFYWFADFYRQQDYHISQSGQRAELKTSQVGPRLCMVKLFNHLQTQLSDHEIQCFVPPIQRYSYYTTVEKTTILLPSCIHWFADLGD